MVVTLRNGKEIAAELKGQWDLVDSPCCWDMLHDPSVMLTGNVLVNPNAVGSTRRSKRSWSATR
jgi:hypothetical protein